MSIVQAVSSRNMPKHRETSTPQQLSRENIAATSAEGSKSKKTPKRRRHRGTPARRSARLRHQIMEGFVNKHNYVL